MSNPSSWKDKTKTYLKAIGITFFCVYAAGLLIALVGVNSAVFKLNKDIFIALNNMINTLVLLGIPFLFGILGALARVMISEMEAKKNYKIILGSGLIASFSWLGIKSQVFIALLTPYIRHDIEPSEALDSGTQSEFYSMALVAVLAGVFASYIYIFINEKVEQLVKASHNKSSNSD